MLRPRYTLHDDPRGAPVLRRPRRVTRRPCHRTAQRKTPAEAPIPRYARRVTRRPRPRHRTPPHPGNAHAARVRSVGSGAGPEEVKRRGGRGLPRVRSVGSTAETAENTRKARSRHMGMDRGLGRVSDRGSERRGGPCRETWMDLRSERASSAGGARVTSRARGHAAVATGLPMKRGEVRSEDRS